MSAESKKNIVKAAMIYSQEGKWDKAISEYKKLLTLDPTDFNVHNMLGDAYSKKGEDGLAYQEYIVAAEAYLKQGLGDKANIIYKKIGRLDSNKLNDRDRQKQILIKKHTTAEKLIESGEIDKAIDTYKEILKLSPANFDTYQKLGELYSEKGNIEEALVYYKKIVDIYFKNRLYKKALPIYQKILELQPDNISIREKIAEIYEREGNESDAKREYLFLAEYYWDEKNIEKTDYYAQKAVEFKSIEAHFFKGAALYNKKQYDDAKKELEMLLRFKANHIGALTVMANVNKELGNTDEALAIYERVAKAEAENTDAYEGMADIYLSKGMKKEAGAKLVLAANVFNSKQKYEEAAEVLNRVIKDDPENIEILSKLGEIYSHQKKKKEAADVYIKISDIYDKEKMADKATEYYKMAEDMDPAHPKIVEKAKKLAEKKPEPPPPPPPKAAAPPPPPKAAAPPPAVKPAAEADPGKEDLIEPLPDIPVKPQAAPGKATEPSKPARMPEPPKEFPQEEYKPQEQTKEDVPALLAMADSYVKSGMFDEAMELYQKAQTLDPKNEEVKKKLNEAYSKYAGVPAPGSPEAAKAKEEKKKKEEEAKKKKEEEQKKKEEEKKKKEEEEKRKKEEEKNKKEEEARKKKDEEKRKKEEDASKKKEEAEKKKKEEDAARKKEEETKKKKEEEEEEFVEEEISDDFVTVTTAEIFIKQGLYSEAQKILKKIMKQDPSNIEAKMKLDDINKMIDETEQSGVNVKDEEAPKKTKQSKVSYI